MTYGHFESLDNDGLLRIYADALYDAEMARDTTGSIEQEIMRRMREQGATSIPSETFVCEVTTSNTLDPSRLIPLKELLLPADLDAAWTPEHEETRSVPERWNGTALNKLARSYGGDVKRIVEEAKVASDPKLKFKRKGE